MKVDNRSDRLSSRSDFWGCIKSQEERRLYMVMPWFKAVKVP